MALVTEQRAYDGRMWMLAELVSAPCVHWTWQNDGECVSLPSTSHSKQSGQRDDQPGAGDHNKSAKSK